MQVNIKKISKLITAKKWDAASEMFAELSYPLKVNFLEAELLTPCNGLQWVISGKDSCEFIFNKSTPQHEYQPCITRLALLMPLVTAFHRSKFFQIGTVFINLGDYAEGAGLAFCSSRSDSILIPDQDFLSSKGYQETKLEFMVNSPPWAMRKPQAFWRGNTTGMRVGEHWRGLPRLQLSELANSTPNQEIFDVGVSSFAQISKKEAKEVQALGYARGFVPMISSSRYKYQIDIDGNSNAWSALFQKLLSGSAVLKIASPHNFRQWYYDELIPWVNFVPVKSDMSDLVEKIHWLIDHDDEAMQIGINGRKLASKLTYDEELNKALINIHKALK